MIVINTMGLLSVLFMIAAVVIEIHGGVVESRSVNTVKAADTPVKVKPKKASEGGDLITFFRDTELKNGTAEGKIEVHFVDGEVRYCSRFHIKNGNTVTLDGEPFNKSDVLMVLDI